MQLRRRPVIRSLLAACLLAQGLPAALAHSEAAEESAAAPAAAAAKPSAVLFENVRIFNGTADRLSPPSHVLVVGNQIQAISSTPIATPADVNLVKVAGAGRTLMPGLIDAHTHIMFSSMSKLAILTSDVGFVNVVAVKEAHDTLMRGFTSIRDLGGPSLGLKKGIDLGLASGPRIWSSGAFISQTGGHGDFRLPVDLPAPAGRLQPQRARRGGRDCRQPGHGPPARP